MATPLPQAATCPPGLGFQQAGGFAAAEAHGTEGSFGDGVPQVIRPFAGGGNTRVGDSSRVGAQSAGVGWDQPPADTVLQLQEEVDKMKQEVVDLRKKQAGTQAQLARKRAREAEWCEEAGRVAVAVAEGMKGFKDDMVSSINKAGNAAVQAGHQADKQLQAADHGVSACKKLKRLTTTLESFATSVNAQEAAEDEHAD